MKTFKFIQNIPNHPAEQRLYALSEPLEEFFFVIVSAVHSAFDTNRPETYIFGSDEKGEILSWLELPGSEQGIYDHEQVLNNAGYTKE